MSKFNDYDTLLSSYNQLEKQFTKKCQQLSQLQKQCGTSTHSTPNQAMTPPHDKETFFAAYPRAKQYEQDIDKLVSSPKYNNDSDGYIRSYVDCLENGVVSPQSKHAEDYVLEQYLHGNDDLRDKVLQYMVESQPHAPATISGKGGRVYMAVPTMPKTLEDASKLAKAMISRK